MVEHAPRLGPPLGGLDALPIGDRRFGRRHDGSTRPVEDVGMASDHLLGDRANHIGKGEAARLARDLSVKDDLKKQVAKFVA